MFPGVQWVNEETWPVITMYITRLHHPTLPFLVCHNSDVSDGKACNGLVWYKTVDSTFYWRLLTSFCLRPKANRFQNRKPTELSTFIIRDGVTGNPTVRGNLGCVFRRALWFKTYGEKREAAGVPRDELSTLWAQQQLLETLQDALELEWHYTVFSSTCPHRSVSEGGQP